MRAGTAAMLASVSDEEAPVLEEVCAEATIDDLLAEVTLTQRYRNAAATNIEAVYTFPLPLDGVLLGLEVEIGERRLLGKIVGKAAAERRYEEAITDGDAAVLLEQAGPGLYTASVGNLMRGETATIRVRYGLLLRWNGDRVRLSLPTTIAPRYGDPAMHGLEPHQAPEHAFDAERGFSLSVTVRGLLAGARFTSPSHDVAMAPQTEATVIELAGRPAMDRDVVIEARAARPRQLTATLDRDLDGWVVLASFRPEIPEGAERAPRSVKVVVDCSGSMTGDSIAQARVALERILDGLHAGDLFDIVAFGSHHRALFGRETPVSEASLAEARRFVRALDTNMGGTEIGDALAAAYGISGELGLPRDLLLITDGEVWNSDLVVARARASGHRIFSVGVGSAVAEPFVRALADATGGACELVAPREDMVARIHRHFQRLYAPRAKEAVLRLPAGAARHAPDPIGPVFGGDTVHAFVWFAEKAEGRVGLDVTLADGRVLRHEAEITPVASLAEEPAEAGAITTQARLGAAMRLKQIDDEQEATELALQYRLMSQWTNCIVVHERADADKAEDLPEIRKVPQVLAAGWHGMGSACASDPGVLYCLADTAHSERAPRAMFRRIREADPLRLAESRSASRFTLKPPDLMLLAPGVPDWPTLTLDAIERLGVPDDVLSHLRDLADRGEDEETIVVVLLHLIAQSESHRVDRGVRRQILSDYRKRTPSPGLEGAVRAALERWRAQNDDSARPARRLLSALRRRLSHGSG